MSKATIFYTLVFLSIIILASTNNSFKINKIQRQILLNSHYPIEHVKISFTALQNQVSTFQHVVPIQYDINLNKIAFMKTKDNKHHFQHTRSQYIFNGKKYAVYKVDLQKSYFQNQEGEFNIVAIYLNRYVNFPETITMAQDQKFQYEDFKYFVSPYQVEEQQNIYKFDKLLNYDKDGQVKGLSIVSYKKKNASPFFIQNHVIHGTNNDPQVAFSEVQRIIQVSHWGNIAITQFYKIKNLGPSLKGEFSRVQFGSQSQAEAKNTFRGIQGELPLSAWGLYYRDEVGNISTSRAYRDEYGKKVVFALAPRYGLLGGWKANWEIGYNLNSKGYLYNEGNKFQLDNINLEYTLEKVLTENYSFKIILPEGATGIKVKIGNVQLQPTKITGNYGYLDFIGRPTYEFTNYKGVLKNKEITVDYQLDTISGLQKPIIIFVVIFSLLVISIIFKRLRLDAFQTHKHE